MIYWLNPGCQLLGSRVVKQSKALHLSARGNTTDTLVRIQAVSQPAVARTPIGRRTIGPASSGLGEGLAGIDVLVPSRTSDSCGGPGAVHADTVARCTVFPTTHWCGWLPGWMGIMSRSSAAWLGCVSEDAWLSTFASPESERELQR